MYPSNFRIVTNPATGLKPASDVTPTTLGTNEMNEAHQSGGKSSFEQRSVKNVWFLMSSREVNFFRYFLGGRFQ